MVFRTLPPGPLLSPYIQHYQYTSILGPKNVVCNQMNSLRPLPNGNFELFFHLNDSIVSVSSEKYKMEQMSCFFVGYHDLFFKSTIVTHPSSTSFTVVFKPLGFFTLFGYKESEITNNISPGELIFKKLKFIWEALNDLENDDFYQMREVFEQGTIKNNSMWVKRTSFLQEIIFFIKYKQGMVSIKEICNNFNVNRRKVERSFRDLLGLSAFEYIRIIRANNLLSSITDGSPLLQTVLNYGYYDQSHFIKDFKKIIGLSPKAYLKNAPSDLLNKSYTNRIFLPNLTEI